MNNKLIFLRHGLVKKDPNKPVIERELTKQSLEKVKKLKLPKIDIFLASTENKALQTLQPITKEIKQLKEERQKLLSLLAELDDLIGEIIDKILEEAENGQGNNSTDSG